MLFDRSDPLSKLMPTAPKDKGPKTPTYTTGGRVVRKGLSRRAKALIVVSVVVVLLAAAAGVIYLPQYFEEDHFIGSPIAARDKTGWLQMQAYVSSNPESDFDGDGLTNAEELVVGSNPYFQDSDLDGVMDKQDTKPMAKGKAVLNTMKSLGQDIDVPMAMNGVILWPDDNESWAHGGVIQVQSGYQFTNYRGWAKFQTAGIAYQYKDGRHTPLSYRKDIDAYYIDGNCLVTLEKSEKAMTYLIKFFDDSTYMQGSWGKFLASVLPDKGWITGQAMWLDDTFIDVTKDTTLPRIPLKVEPAGNTRFLHYTSELKDLSATYALIDEGYFVLTSLMSKDMGEMIVAVYGYTAEGNLLIMNAEEPEWKGELKVVAHCGRCLTYDNNVSLFSYFTFEGCGYSSDNGDLISFFSAVPIA